jgi:DNA-binding PadR family transcriptional regulator
MSIRHGLLALLSAGPRYGYQLRAEFEAATGSSWPLNIGQVYTTLARAERDGLAEVAETDAQGRVMYQITDAGRVALAGWFGGPVAITDRPRDELAVKLALALVAPGVDIARVVQIQRTATMRHLQEVTRLKSPPEQATPSELGWALVRESMIFQAEAEIRWLDHCEAYLTRAARLPRPHVVATPDPVGDWADPAAVAPSGADPHAADPHGAGSSGTDQSGASVPSARRRPTTVRGRRPR